MCKSQTCGSGVENLQRLISIRWISDGLELKRKKRNKTGGREDDVEEGSEKENVFSMSASVAV